MERTPEVKVREAFTTGMDEIWKSGLHTDAEQALLMFVSGYLKSAGLLDPATGTRLMRFAAWARQSRAHDDHARWQQALRTKREAG